MSIIENANPSVLSHLCDDDILKIATECKDQWSGVDELDDDNVGGPGCSSNYAWEQVDGEWYLVFDANGLCGIHVSIFLD